MAFTDMDEVEQELSEEQPQGGVGGSNRTFWIIAGSLIGIMVLALICMGIYAATQLPELRQRGSAANETRAAQATEISFAASQTASAPTATPIMRPTNTPRPTIAPTSTPLLAGVASSTHTEGFDPSEATQSALMTEFALAASVTVGPTSTLLPGTGLADEIGTPGLLVMAVVLVVVIFLVRRLRSS